MVKYGEPVTLRVSAVGSGYLTYQWKKDGKPIRDSGTCESTLTIPSFGYQHQGIYTCKVSDGLHQKPIESTSANLRLSKYKLVTVVGA